MAKVIDLDGRERVWNLTGHTVAGLDDRKRSGLHIRAREILYNLFPTLPILEEVPIPIKLGTTQYLDFYIATIKLAVEVHGSQHYAFNSMFHKSRLDFLRQKKNDNDKKEWCRLNNINILELPYNKESEWEKIIKRR